MSFDKTRAKFKRWRAFQRFQSRRLTFLNDLGVALKGGSDLSSALAESADRCEDASQAYVYRSIKEKVSAGSLLAPALGVWFTPMERMLLDAFLQNARTNDDIGAAFDKMVSVVKPYALLSEEADKTAILTIITFFVCVFAVVGTVFVIFELEGAIAGDKWPPFVSVVFSVAHALQSMSIFLAMICTAVPVVLGVSLRYWSGPIRRRWDRKVPGFVIYREAQAARVMIALGAFSAAGTSIAETCRNLSPHGSPWLRWYLREIQRRSLNQQGASIVDVKLFGWQLMVRIACLCMGQTLPHALREVGLYSSHLVAQSLVERLKNFRYVVFLAYPIVGFSCVAVLIAMSVGLVQAVKSAVN